LGEANRINSPIKEDKAKLELSGIKQHYPDSFEAHVGAMTWSAAQIITYINNVSTAEKEWDKLKPIAKKKRDVTL
jgi:hypothetical protein